MLYLIAKWIARLTLHSYFRRIMVNGYENAPPKGPVIFVANHPSAFMDPMVLASVIKRALHFMVAAEFFGKGLKSRIYTNYLNMIPVYRPSILPNEAHNNEIVFKKAHELLNAGGALLVFPEGNSVTEKRIRKLKTGVARMALGAREQSLDKLEVAVVPIGLNYANPHRFQSDLFINIGKPLSTRGFSSDKTEVLRFTEELEARLKQATLHVQTEGLDSVVKKADLILKRKFKEERITIPGKEAEFLFQKKVAASLQHLSETEPQQIAKLEGILNVYLAKLKMLGLSDRSIADLSILISGRELFRLIFTFPIFSIGLAINAIPYYATVFYFRSLNLFSREGFEPTVRKINPAFKGSVAMAIGMVIFIAGYLLFATLCGWMTRSLWIGLGSVVVFYLSGLFAMQYIRWVYTFQQKWRFRRLMNKKPGLFASLITERKEIIDELMNVINK